MQRINQDPCNSMNECLGKWYNVNPEAKCLQKTELYNPSKYENRSKDNADHVKINKKIGAICIMTQRYWQLRRWSKCDLERRNLHAYNCEDLAKIGVRKGAKNKIMVLLKIATKNQCLWNIGVGSLWDNEKCELAANNGDTLGEAVIFAKGTNSD